MQLIKSEYEEMYDRWLIRIQKSGIRKALCDRMRTPWHRLAFRLLSKYRVRDCRVLVVGCGIGSFSIALAQRGATVTSVDLAKGAVAIVRNLSAKLGLKIDVVEGDAQNLPCASSCYDFALSLETLEHVPDLGRALREILRCVKSGGHILLTFPNVLTPIGLYLRIVSQQSFERALSPHLLKKELMRNGRAKLLEIQGACYFLRRIEQKFPNVFGTHTGCLAQKL